MGLSMSIASTLQRVFSHLTIRPMEEVLNNYTTGFRVGCGKIYISVLYDDKKRFRKVMVHRNSKFKCDLVTRDNLAKMVTYQARRSLKQALRDLTGEKFSHHCDMYVVGCESSCGDAIAKTLRLWLKEKRKRKQSMLK